MLRFALLATAVVFAVPVFAQAVIEQGNGVTITRNAPREPWMDPKCADGTPFNVFSPCPEDIVETVPQPKPGECVTVQNGNLKAMRCAVPKPKMRAPEA